MTKLIYSILISIVLTVSAWTLPIFYSGIEFIYLPFMLVLFLTGIAGIITIPYGVFKAWGHKSIRSNKWLQYSIGTALGFYIGYIILIPIDNWDDRQRNLSGQLISQKLQAYKASHGTYPKSLKDIDISNLNSSLPTAYKIDRFSYTSEQNKFDLDIPVPFLDRWHWDENKQIFIYRD
jgi:hypothetical protein